MRNQRQTPFTGRVSDQSYPSLDVRMCIPEDQEDEGFCQSELEEVQRKCNEERHPFILAK